MPNELRTRWSYFFLPPKIDQVSPYMNTKTPNDQIQVGESRVGIYSKSGFYSTKYILYPDECERNSHL